jgi:hypothetical protein
MGSIGFIDLFDVRDELLGEARPVGKVENVVLTSATRVANKGEDQGGYGDFVFAEEIPLQFLMISRQAEADGVTIRRQEFKAMPVEGAEAINEGMRLVVCQAPHSSYWVSVAQFRGWRRSDRKPEVLFEVTTPWELSRAVESSSNDLFESRKDVLTAAVEEDDFRVFFRPSVRAKYKDLCHVLGVVEGSEGKLENYHAVELAILRSSRLQSTLKAVAAGEPVGPMRNMFVPHALRDELESLMLFSVRQALAGPGAEKNAGKFVGQPVGLYARHLFMDHAHNLARSADETRCNLHVDSDVLEKGDLVQQQIARFLAAHYA